MTHKSAAAPELLENGGPGGRAANIHIRPFASMKDCSDCVDLQREIWGFEERDIVPASLLHVVDFVSGVAAGAFDGDGKLLGFVFGITGIHDGQTAHWSHMLGVSESVRNLGVGLMLKEYQRSRLAELGVVHIFWTFDPLMAKNAYFNLNRLGADVVEYVADMYGSSASRLHFGLPTDRVVVCLSTTGPRSSPPMPSDTGDLPVLTPFPRPGDRTISASDGFSPLALVEIPADMVDEAARAPARAATWRAAVREHFQWALQHGYSARGVSRQPATGRSFYVMARTTD